MGQKLDGSELSPALCNGMIFDIFQIWGKILLVILRLHICCITGTMMGPPGFNNIDVIPSVSQEDDG